MYFFIKLILTIILLFFIAKNIDFNELLRIFNSISFKFIFLAFLIQFLLTSLKTLRWKIICLILNMNLSFFHSWKNILIGYFFNQTLPSSIGGDAVRILMLSNYGYKIPFQTVLIDRLFGLLTICLIVIFGKFFLNEDIINKITFFKSMILFPAIFIVFFLIITSLNYFQTKIKYLKKILSYLRLSGFLKSLNKIFFNYFNLIKILCFSFLIHLVTAYTGFLVLKSLNVNVDFIHFSILFCMVLLLSNIPISIGGWGVRESLMIFCMNGIGLQNEMALTLSILFGFIMILVGLPGGFLWLVNQMNSELEIFKLFKK